jgi:hypothetical protein
MMQFSDDTYGEERAIEKLFRCILEKYKQIARSIESLLDLSTMSIKEAIGHLKIIDGDEPQPLSGPITIGEKLHLTQEQWEACQSDGKKGESPPSMGGRKRGKRHKPWGGTQARAQLWQAWPLGQGVSTVTTRPGPRRIGGGGGASSAPGTCKHRVISSGIDRNGSPPP